MAVKDGGAIRSESVDHTLKRRTRRISPKVVIKTKQILSKQAQKIVKQADEHENFLNKIKYCLGVFCFGTFCYLLGSRPQDIPKLYCLFFLTVAPLRWIYYRIRKWHYYLLDFCYYANVIFMVMLMYFPNNEKLFMICFSFSEGPLSWALIVWRCSLVFSSLDKIISVLIHLLPGTVFFIIRWWDPITFPHHSAEATGPWPAWPVVMTERALWTWLFMVPLFAYTVWQILYFLIVNGLRRQRLLNDPEIMTSYRELSRKASKANNIWWQLSGLLGDGNREVMYAVLQALFTVATMALTVPMFKSYRMHIVFELLKVVATIWNGGNFFFEVMPREVSKKEKRAQAKRVPPPRDHAKESSDKKYDSNLPLLNSIDYSGVLKVEDQLVCSLCKQASSPLSDYKDLVKEMNEYLERDQSQPDQAEAHDTTGAKLSKTMSWKKNCADCIDRVGSGGFSHFDQISCSS